MPELVLNLGCGDHRLSGAIGVDRDRSAKGADLVCDLDRPPYPFRAQSCARIVCRDVLEHLDHVPAVMAELHRLLRRGGVLEIRVPHFSSMDAYIDPTHRRFLSAHSFDFWLEGAPRQSGLGNTPRFRLLRRHIHFLKAYRWLGIAALANRWSRRWEAHLAFCLPAQYVELELEAVS